MNDKLGNEVIGNKLAWTDYMTGTVKFGVYECAEDIIVFVCHGEEDGSVYGLAEAWNWAVKNLFQAGTLPYANSEAEAMENIAMYPDNFGYICCFSGRVAAKYGVQALESYDEKVVFVQEADGFRFYGKSENPYLS